MNKFTEFKHVGISPIDAPETLRCFTDQLFNTVTLALGLLHSAQFPIKALVVDVDSVGIHWLDDSGSPIDTAGYEACDVSISELYVSIALTGEFGVLEYQVETSFIINEGRQL